MLVWVGLGLGLGLGRMRRGRERGIGGEEEGVLVCVCWCCCLLLQPTRAVGLPQTAGEGLRRPIRSTGLLLCTLCLRAGAIAQWGALMMWHLVMQLVVLVGCKRCRQ